MDLADIKNLDFRRPRMHARSILALTTLALVATSWARAEDPERKKILAEIENETATLNKLMDEKVADLVPKQKALRDKVALKEKTLKANTRKRFNTKNSQEALKKLRAELQVVDDEYGKRLAQLQPDKDRLEQRRRAVLKKYPEPGDPTFVEHEGRLLTDDEWLLEKSRYPGSVAEAYIQDLLQRGVIRSAAYTKITRHALALDTRSDGSPIRDFMNVNFTVQYVSKGGVLNERNAWVTVVSADGSHWVVSPMMKQLEVLGGLP